MSRTDPASVRDTEVTRRRWILLAVIAAIGIALTVVASAAYNMSPGAAVHMAALAGGAALIAGAVGALLLLALRRRSVAVQATVVALVTVGAVGGGAVAAARAMFLSSHDLGVLAVIVPAAATVGAIIAVVLGGRVVLGSRALGRVVRGVEGEGPRDAASSGRAFASVASSTPELARLGAELDRMTKRLEEARSRERALDASRRELVAWVSHDLRTPLSGMRAIAEAIEDGVLSDPDELRRYCRTLRVEIDRLSGLVDDLFELSKIESGALQLHLERASLEELVSDAVAASAPRARTKGITVEGRLKAPDPHLDVEPAALTRVLRNLLENAIRHTPSDGTIVVRTDLDGGDAVVSVADECGGIPEEHLDRVFDPAFRGEPARTPRSDGGAGLGLAIARGIVEAHRGEITVANDGAGCRFVIRLPLAHGDLATGTRSSIGAIG